MTHQEILEKAIQKAIDGGWAYWLYEGFADFEVIVTVDSIEPLVRFHLSEYSQQLNYEAIIYNHDFAKALWGHQPIIKPAIRKDGEIFEWKLPAWQYHLQQMVIAEDPIKYLGENI